MPAHSPHTEYPDSRGSNMHTIYVLTTILISGTAGYTVGVLMAAAAENNQ